MSVSLFVQDIVLQSVICYVCKPLYVSFVTLSLSLFVSHNLLLSQSLLFAANHILCIMHFVKKRKDGAKKEEANLEPFLVPTTLLAFSFSL